MDTSQKLSGVFSPNGHDLGAHSFLASKAKEPSARGFANFAGRKLKFDSLPFVGGREEECVR